MYTASLPIISLLLSLRSALESLAPKASKKFASYRRTENSRGTLFIKEVSALLNLSVNKLVVYTGPVNKQDILLHPMVLIDFASSIKPAIAAKCSMIVLVNLLQTSPKENFEHRLHALLLQFQDLVSREAAKLFNAAAGIYPPITKIVSCDDQPEPINPARALTPEISQLFPELSISDKEYGDHLKLQSSANLSGKADDEASDEEKERTNDSDE